MAIVRRHALVAIALALLLPMGPAPAAYPEKPVTFVVPFPPGGRTDLTARLLAQHLPKHLGQAAVVVNKPGAGGVLGAKELAGAAPDGYTLGVFSTAVVTATGRPDNMGQLDGKVAIVTGSGRGIGQQVALRLARDGAAVVVNDLDNAPARETISLVEKLGGRAVACNGDVTAKDFGERIVETAVQKLGGLHVIVNNAGYTWDNVIQKMTDEQWYAIMDVHVTAPFRILRAFAPYLRSQFEAESKRGERVVRKVVQISSTSGVRGNAGQVNYSSAKAAVTGMTRTLAKEWGRYAVTVNCVAFGYIQTRLTKPLAEGEAGTIEVAGRQVRVGVQGARIAAMNQMIPLGRGGLPEEAAGAIYLFCSPDSDFVSGQTLVVTGGA